MGNDTISQLRGLWSRAGGLTTIIMTLLGWSSVPLFLRHFSHLIDPWTSNGWRYGFSALLWLPVVIWGLARRTLPRGIWRAAIVPSGFNCGAQVIFCLAHYKLEPGLLTFGLRSNIVFATVGAAIFFAAERRVIRLPGFIAGVLMVVGGTMGTILLGDSLPRGATLAGVLLAVSSGAGFAFYALAVRHWMHGVNAIQSFAVISLYTAVGMVALMVILGDRAGLPALDLVAQPSHAAGVPIPGGQFTVLLISAIIGIALGHVFYYHSINKLGLAVSAGVVQLQPFFVSIGSLYLFGELLKPQQWASGAVAVLGAATILYVQHRAKKRHSPTVEEFPADHVVAAVEAEREKTP